MGMDEPSRLIRVPSAEWSSVAASVGIPGGEVSGIYVPLVLQISEQASTTGRRPFVVGLAGSVAVGKSATASLLGTLLSGTAPAPRVDVVATDGFLYPNATLERLGLMGRKGFPESYDIGHLLRLLADLQTGPDSVEAPIYSHAVYDVLPGETQSLVSPDIVIIEGVNALAPPISETLDFAIYIDADEADIETWYIERFLELRSAADDASFYLHRYAALDHGTAVATARRTWAEINSVNLRQHIRPSRERADVILEKGPDHRVRRIHLRASEV